MQYYNSHILQKSQQADGRVKEDKQDKPNQGSYLLLSKGVLFDNPKLHKNYHLFYYIIVKKSISLRAAD